MKTFAAIDVGSYELAMKIFEVSSGSGLREIDHIRHRIDLGMTLMPPARSAMNVWTNYAGCFANIMIS